MHAATTESSAAPDAFGANALLIKDLLDSGLARSPSQEIVYGTSLRFDYAELSRRIARLAAGLASLGAGPGDTIAVMDWDTHRYLECFFAVPMAGMVLHTVNVRLSAEQLLYTINHANDDFILVNAEFLPMLDAIWDGVDPGKRLVLLSDDGASVNTRLPIAAEYEDLLARTEPTGAWPDLVETTRATTFYTTGTTGLPKAVHFSHRQLVLHTLASRAALSGPGAGRFNHDDVYMPVTPMFHVHAWGLPYVATMMGVKQVYPGRYVPDRLLALIEGEGVTFSHCVPTILQMVLDAADARGRRLDGWTVVIGGSALPQAQSPGELIVRAPWLTPSYLGDPQASQALWRGGWLHTGDIAVLEPDGCVRIVDRLKDVIKTGGEWVSSLQLEDILLKHPQIQEAAVIGIADARWGERPAAVIVVRAGASLDAQQAQPVLTP